MPTSTAPKPSARRRKLEEAVEQTSAVLDRKHSSADAATSTIERQDVRSALQRNRQYGDLPIEMIDPDPQQVRKVDTQSDKFQELANSIREHGIINPISVRLIKETGRFQILSGERRFRAAQKITLKAIPAIVRDVSDTDKAVHQLAENLQREDMNPIEEAKAYHRYIAATKCTQEQLAKRIGKSRSYVTQVMGLLERLTIEEQEEMSGISPANLPGRTVILEAIRIPDPAVRRAVLRGELTREQAREHAPQDKKRHSSRGRKKNFALRFDTADRQASVVVRFKKPDATHEEVLDVLEKVVQDFRKRSGRTSL